MLPRKLFSQTWINDLRNKSAECVASVNTINGNAMMHNRFQKWFYTPIDYYLTSSWCWWMCVRCVCVLSGQQPQLYPKMKFSFLFVVLDRACRRLPQQQQNECYKLNGPAHSAAACAWNAFSSSTRSTFIQQLNWARKINDIGQKCRGKLHKWVSEWVSWRKQNAFGGSWRKIFLYLDAHHTSFDFNLNHNENEGFGALDHD